MKAILLHGTDGNENSNWIPWLKAQLEERGYEVYAPSLPEADYPNGEKWANFILKNVPFEIDDETILVGHSAGAALLPQLLQKLSAGTHVKRTILVSGFHDTLGWDKLKDLFNIEVDYPAVRQKAGELLFLHSDDDPYVALEQPQWLINQMGGRLLLIKNQGHFNLEFSPKYKEFPKLLELVLQG